MSRRESRFRCTSWPCGRRECSYSPLLRATWVPTLATLPAIAAAMFVGTHAAGSLAALVLGGLAALAVYLAAVGHWLLHLFSRIRDDENFSA